MSRHDRHRQPGRRRRRRRARRPRPRSPTWCSAPARSTPSWSRWSPPASATSRRAWTASPELRAAHPELPLLLVPMGGLSAPVRAAGRDDVRRTDGRAMRALGRAARYAAWRAHPRAAVEAGSPEAGRPGPASGRPDARDAPRPAAGWPRPDITRAARGLRPGSRGAGGPRPGRGRDRRRGAGLPGGREGRRPRRGAQDRPRAGPGRPALGARGGGRGPRLRARARPRGWRGAGAAARLRCRDRGRRRPGPGVRAVGDGGRRRHRHRPPGRPGVPARRR